MAWELLAAGAVGGLLVFLAVSATWRKSDKDSKRWQETLVAAQESWGVTFQKALALQKARRPAEFVQLKKAIEEPAEEPVEDLPKREGPGPDDIVQIVDENEGVILDEIPFREFEQSGYSLDQMRF